MGYGDTAKAAFQAIRIMSIHNLLHNPSFGKTDDPFISYLKKSA